MQKSFYLGKGFSIFTSELYAILMALSYICNIQLAIYNFLGMVGLELQCSEDGNIKCMCVLYHLFISIWKKEGVSLLHEANHGSIHSEGRNNLTLNKCNNNIWHHFVLAELVN